MVVVCGSEILHTICTHPNCDCRDSGGGHGCARGRRGQFERFNGRSRSAGGFQVGLEASGFVKPTAFAFAPDGRWFVAGKDGRVWVVNPPGVINADGTTQKVLLDIRNKVNANSDRGLNGIALDKDFATNGLLYLLYVNELQPSTPDQGGPMVSRLTRVTVTPSNTVSPETVVLGTYSAGPCPTADNAVDCIHAGIEVPRANATAHADFRSIWATRPRSH
jgi:glucose/sorbosone dehydrogenase